jgi:hypothetical protein
MMHEVSSTSPAPSVGDVLTMCLRDAAERIGARLSATERTSIEGRFVLVERDGEPFILAASTPVDASPFDPDVRDRARNVAARVRAPYILVTSLRQHVLYITDNVTKRLFPEQQIALHGPTVELLDVADALVSSTRIRLTESLRQCLLHAEERGLATPERLSEERNAKGAMQFLAERVGGVLREIRSCVEDGGEQTDPVDVLVIGIVSYAILSMRDRSLPHMDLPLRSASPELHRDIVEAYFKEARRRRYQWLDTTSTDVVIQPGRQALFSAVMTDLSVLLDEMQLGRFTSDDMRYFCDLMRSTSNSSREAEPTIDAIDLALTATGVFDRPHSDSPRCVEIGGHGSPLGERLAAVFPQAECYVHGTVARGGYDLLRRAVADDVAWEEEPEIDSSTVLNERWDIVSFTALDDASVVQMKRMLASLNASSIESLILFTTTSFLRDDDHADARDQLLSRFHVRWVFASDADPLTEPISGSCLIVADGAEGAHDPSVSFCLIRRPFAELVPIAPSSRSLSMDRLERLRIFLRYLTTSQYGKSNAEVAVRRLDRTGLHYRTKAISSGWDDLIIPADTIASILSKITGRVQPLDAVSVASGGLRTGAIDVLAPSLNDIVSAGIEERFWRRPSPRSSGVIDNMLLSSIDEATSIAGLIDTDRRLLLLPTQREEFNGTRAAEVITEAEAAGVPSRPSLRHREPWWHFDDVAEPDLIVPKQQRHRWLVIQNQVGTFTTDSFINITLHDHLRQEGRTESLALWMNSTLGLFMSELVQRSTHVADATVRDVQEFPVPLWSILDAVDVKRHHDLLRRPIGSIQEEYGCEIAEQVDLSRIRKDRRRLDRVFMEEHFDLTPEEQLWIYRLALAWRSSANNIRHLASALAADIMQQRHLRPLREWYTIRIEQLPDQASRAIIMPPEIGHAEVASTMFAQQVRLFRDGKKVDVLDCSSADEAELITLLVNLGKRSVDVPTDPPLIGEVLPVIRSFVEDLEASIEERTSALPSDLRDMVQAEIRAVFTS